MSFLPSKKIFFALIVAIIVILFGFFGGGDEKKVRTDPNRSKSDNTLSVVVSESAKNEAERDTDGDGLKDWEEILWGTNPKNTDTDGNGVSDKEEIDKLAEEAQEKQLLVSSENGQITIGQQEDPSKTQILATEFFSNYFSLRNPATGFPKEQLGFVIDNSIREATGSGTQAVKSYSARDLRLTQGSASNSKEYGNALGRAITNNPINENPVDILSRAILYKSNERVEELKGVAKIYRNSVDELLLVRVPSDMTTLHVKLLNTLSLLEDDMERVSRALEDPVGALIAIQDYLNNLESLGRVIEDIQDNLKGKGVNYSTGEDGYVLFNIL